MTWAKLRQLNFPYVLTTILAASYGAWYWVQDYIVYPGQHAMISGIYRVVDFAYVAPTVRMFTHFFGEPYLIDPNPAFDKMTVAVMGVLPYGLGYLLMGPRGFGLADVMGGVLRVFAFWIFLKPFAANKMVRGWMLFGVFFLACEYTIGGYTPDAMFAGFWGMRYPRTYMSSGYVLLAIAMVTQLPSLLASPVLKKRMIWLYALPIALVVSADPHNMLNIGLVLSTAYIYWFAQNSIPQRNMILYALAVAVLAAPFVLHMSTMSPEFMARFGAYPILDHLDTVEVPLRGHLLFLFLSATSCALIYRYLPKEREMCRVLTLMTAILLTAIFSTLILASLQNTNLFGNNYAMRRNQFANLLMCAWVAFFIRLAAEQIRKPLVACALFAILGTWSAWTSFQGLIEYNNGWIYKTSGPGVGALGYDVPGWRSSADAMLKFMDQRYGDKKLVLGVMDIGLEHMLPFHPNWYTFIPSPCMSDAPDIDIENRFLQLHALIDPGDDFMHRFIATTAPGWISYQKYQFNRITVADDLDTYPPEWLHSLKYFRDFSRWMQPPRVAANLFGRYLEYKAKLRLQGIEKFSEYRLPDLIILNNDGPFLNKTPVGYKVVRADPVLQVYERIGFMN